MQNTYIQAKVLLTERFEKPKEWELEIPGKMSPNEAASFIFELSNAPPEFLTEAKRQILREFPRDGLRSVSVGDVIIIQDAESPLHSHVLTVEPLGFKTHEF